MILPTDKLIARLYGWQWTIDALLGKQRTERYLGLEGYWDMTEVVASTINYGALPEETRKVLSRAMRRSRDRLKPKPIKRKTVQFYRMGY